MKRLMTTIARLKLKFVGTLGYNIDNYPDLCKNQQKRRIISPIRYLHIRSNEGI